MTREAVGTRGQEAIDLLMAELDATVEGHEEIESTLEERLEGVPPATIREHGVIEEIRALAPYEEGQRE